MLKKCFMGKKRTHFFDRGELVKNRSIFFGCVGGCWKYHFEGSKVEVSKRWRIDFFWKWSHTQAEHNGRSTHCGGPVFFVLPGKNWKNIPATAMLVDQRVYCLTGSTIRTLLHGKINPKKWQVLNLGDVGFLLSFRLVSGDYGKPCLRVDLCHGSMTGQLRGKVPLPAALVLLALGCREDEIRQARNGEWIMSCLCLGPSWGGTENVFFLFLVCHFWNAVSDWAQHATWIAWTHVLSSAPIKLVYERNAINDNGWPSWLTVFIGLLLWKCHCSKIWQNTFWRSFENTGSFYLSSWKHTLF